MGHSQKVLRIATRKSPLALWQTEFVGKALTAVNPDLTVEVLQLSTRGDQILDTPLAKVGGKALFVKELEHALLEGSADIAVHSSKDVPVDLPADLELPVILARHDPRDALVSNRYDTLEALPEGARVGTSSLRRRCQLLALRPDLQVEDLRGNVGTRLRKLDEGLFDAIILAAAGLERMGLGERITRALSPEEFLPAIAQGAIGIECRAGDQPVLDRIAPLNDAASQLRVTAERALNRRLNGGCQAPIAGYAELHGDRLVLRGLVGTPDGSEMIAGSRTGDRGEGEALGTALADELLSRGAREILADLLSPGRATS